MHLLMGMGMVGLMSVNAPARDNFLTNSKVGSLAQRSKSSKEGSWRAWRLLVVRARSFCPPCQAWYCWMIPLHCGLQASAIQENIKVLLAKNATIRGRDPPPPLCPQKLCPTNTSCSDRIF